MSTRRSFKAVLFDVDGTLYRQGLLRAAMAAELAASPITARSWRRGVQAARIVREYRHAHEDLRRLGAVEEDEPLAARQITQTAEALGLDAGIVAATVDEWMVRRPLKYLRWCRRPGLLPLLETLGRSGLRLGVLSDYAPELKLEALGASRHFSLALCTTASNVNALKPHPRGFRLACEMWALGPEEVLYVGDRPDVDGEGAVAAGLACAIIDGRRDTDAARRGWFAIRRLEQLRDAVSCAR